MYSINQSWDKLNVCAVGSTYSPEFYSFVKDSKTRSVMEKISIETEEDFDSLSIFLQKHGVQVIRPLVKNDVLIDNKLLPPPLSPRDHFAMIGNKFYSPTPARNRKWQLIQKHFYPKNPPTCYQEFDKLHQIVKYDLVKNHNIQNLFDCYSFDYSSLDPIVDLVRNQGNEIIYDKNIDSAMTCRVGRDLYFGTWPGQNKQVLLDNMQKIFPEYRCHVIYTDGHLDGVFGVVKEGLILCRKDYINVIDFSKLFPEWEIVPISDPTYKKSMKFNQIKAKNAGRWWVPGEECNNNFTEFVDSYMQHCVGNVDETTIGVNVLMLDENNLICSEEDDEVFKILHRHAVNVHIIPNRHNRFWDNGIHCITCDLDRSGSIKDYFPTRI